MDRIVVNNSSLSIVTCPVCHRAISVYMDTGMDTVMKCPLCRKQYPFEKVLDGLPPMLEIAEDSDIVETRPREAKKFNFDEIPAPAPIRRPGRNGSHKPGSQPAPDARPTEVRRPSRRRSSTSTEFTRSNPIRETVLFIVGGLMALPVGQLVIWWGIGNDPLSLGPTVSEVFPAVVPEKFRSAPSEEPADEDTEDESGGTSLLPRSPLDPENVSGASIGVVPQELNIDPFLNPYDTLEVQAGLYGVPARRRRTDELLAVMGLADKARAYARSLSGGMRRRLLVCKAMVHDPPVLVLDEPTAGVDIELRQQLWDYVRTLNDGGVTVILTTHYLEEAEAMCDRVAIIDQGAVKAAATTQELLSTIDRKTLVLRPARAVASLDAFRAALPAAAQVERRDDGAIAIDYRRRETPLRAVLAAAEAAGVEIADLTTEEAHLEDVFLEITGGRTNASENADRAPAAQRSAIDD